MRGATFGNLFLDYLFILATLLDGTALVLAASLVVGSSARLKPKLLTCVFNQVRGKSI